RLTARGRQRCTGPEAQGCREALARAGRADASLNLATAGRADALALLALEGALLEACGDHEPRRRESRDGGNCDVRFAMHAYFLAFAACFKRRACGCAWKYNSRLRRSDTCV